MCAGGGGAGQAAFLIPGLQTAGGMQSEWPWQAMLGQLLIKTWQAGEAGMGYVVENR